MRPIPFYAHDLGEAELKAIAEVFAGPILTTGDAVARFEQRFAEYLGCRAAVGLTSCTGGLQLALTALGATPGDEVITCPMTFIATATAILQAGATPVFVDAEPTTGNIDVDRIEQSITERTRAIVPVHLYGQMCDMRRIRDIADRHGLVVVEDAAHCVEGSRDGVRPGELSEAACFSFYATKSLTCGEGGAAATNDLALADRLRLLRLHGMTSDAARREREGYEHWDMVEMGWKYNMDNIQAAILLPQLDRLDRNRERRRALAELYSERLRAVDGVSLPEVLDPAAHARHLFTIWVDPERRDAVIEGLKAARVGVAVNYRPVHQTSYFRDAHGLEAGAFPVAERIGARTISLPLYACMPEADVGAVVDRLAEALASVR